MSGELNFRHILKRTHYSLLIAFNSWLGSYLSDDIYNIKIDVYITIVLWCICIICFNSYTLWYKDQFLCCKNHRLSCFHTIIFQTLFLSKIEAFNSLSKCKMHGQKLISRLKVWQFKMGVALRKGHKRKFETRHTITEKVEAYLFMFSYTIVYDYNYRLLKSIK